MHENSYSYGCFWIWKNKEEGRREKGEEVMKTGQGFPREHLKEAKKNCSGSVSLPRDLIDISNN
jgi:hypothetical protein